MSSGGKEVEASRSKSSSLRMLNHILTHEKDDGRKTAAGNKPTDKSKKAHDNSKLNASIDKSKNRGGSDIGNQSLSKLGLGKGTSKTGSSPTQSKGFTQISQLKNILVGYKGQIQDKKTGDSTSGTTPISSNPAKGRQGTSGSSTSVTKLNTSMERSRVGQKSVDLKSKLLKAAAEKGTSNLNNSRTSIKKENLNSSTAGANDTLNKTLGGGSKSIKNGTPKTKQSLVSNLGSKLFTSKSTTKMSVGSSSKFGKTHETNTEDDPIKELSHVGESTKDNSRKKPSSSSSTSKLGNKGGIGSSISYEKTGKTSTVNRSRTEEASENYPGKEKAHESCEDESSKIPANDPALAKDFKKKPVETNSHKLASIVTQVKPGHMFNESSTKQIDLDKEIQHIHTPRGDLTPRNNKDIDMVPKIDSREAWKCYYVKNLIEHLKNEDDSITMVKIYKEHFYQTVQSVLFLQNVEKIDENLLVEKKVYLPPNILSRKA